MNSPEKKLEKRTFFRNELFNFTEKSNPDGNVEEQFLINKLFYHQPLACIIKLGMIFMS